MTTRLKHDIAVVLATLCACFFMAIMYNSTFYDKLSSLVVDKNAVGDRIYISNNVPPVVSKTDCACVESSDRLDVLEYIRQRNNVSRLLNQKQKMIGQMECEKRASKVATSSSGGYCKEASEEKGHITDKNLIPALADLFKGKLVASFGDGPGKYKQLLLETDKLKGCEAYDGAPYTEVTSEGRVSYLDLTLPQYGLPVYDWIMSLEVAEHIPRQFESIFIDNIARHAKEGVVLSWAVPGQDGNSHVNPRSFDYVVSVMGRHGFEHDENETQKLKNAAKVSWLKSNTNVYRRKTFKNKELMNMQQNA